MQMISKQRINVNASQILASIDILMNRKCFRECLSYEQYKNNDLCNLLDSIVNHLARISDASFVYFDRSRESFMENYAALMEQKRFSKILSKMMRNSNIMYIVIAIVTICLSIDDRGYIKQQRNCTSIEYEDERIEIHQCKRSILIVHYENVYSSIAKCIKIDL